jgi:hypothetical protein
VYYKVKSHICQCGLGSVIVHRSVDLVVRFIMGGKLPA